MSTQNMSTVHQASICSSCSLQTFPRGSGPKSAQPLVSRSSRAALFNTQICRPTQACALLTGSIGHFLVSILDHLKKAARSCVNKQVKQDSRRDSAGTHCSLVEKAWYTTHTAAAELREKYLVRLNMRSTGTRPTPEPGDTDVGLPVSRQTCQRCWPCCPP